MLTPAEFSQQALQAMEASEGRSKKRHRDQTPDRLGMELKRDLLRRVTAEQPTGEDFEAWLLRQVWTASAGGPVRAMAAEILDEYRFACLDPGFQAWLAQGAPSADAEAGEACPIVPPPG